MFFISGLPESGEMLATALISRFCKKAEPKIKNRAGFNFMGSHIMKHFSRDTTKWGWGKVIEIFNLEVIECLTLPTYWTNDLPTDTAYVYTVYQILTHKIAAVIDEPLKVISDHRLM